MSGNAVGSCLWLAVSGAHVGYEQITIIQSGWAQRWCDFGLCESWSIFRLPFSPWLMSPGFTNEKLACLPAFLPLSGSHIQFPLFPLWWAAEICVQHLGVPSTTGGLLNAWSERHIGIQGNSSASFLFRSCSLGAGFSFWGLEDL